MKMLALALLAASPAMAADQPYRGCGTPRVEYDSDLLPIFSQRAVLAINLAAVSGGKPTPALERLIDPAARFSSGAGDVGIPLPRGAAGAIALARQMHADTFRFLGWNYIPSPLTDPCGKHQVQVEFIDTRGKTIFPVTFTFEKGRIVAAEGWRRTFQSGRIAPVRR